MTTIESHYNTLKEAAVYARSIIVSRISELPQGYRHQELKARICAKATELAEQDWPRLRSELAAKGDWLPSRGPRTFDTSGYTVTSFSMGRNICGSSESLTGEPAYHEQAYAALLPELTREAEAAEAAFESYRRAVEQGVAIAPGS
jgi:hypothetical protein